MTFNIKNITVKNFLSVGNQTQGVDFDKEHLTLVLGENLDLGGDDSGSRNGTGKTTMINALSYALYGQALTNIRKENLINKTNGKNMLVTVEFDVNGVNYRIERGRKPNVLKLYVNDQEQGGADESEDDAQGDSRETQKHIETLLGMSHLMFKHLVALNTYTEPFLSLKASDQREIIEQLLGITLLSEKAESLKLQMKDTKDAVQTETFRIDGIKTANENVQKSIDSLVLKSSAWETKKQSDVENLSRAIMQLESVDIDAELVAHTRLKQWTEDNTKLRNIIKQKSQLETALIQAEKTRNKYQKELEDLANKTCPACEQDLHDHKHEEMTVTAEKHLAESKQYHDKVFNDVDKLNKEILDIGIIDKKPNTFYETEAEALGHKNNLDSLEKNLVTRADEANPYDEQIEELERTAIQEISWDTVNELTCVKDHQEFLYKLLTNKDSFVRKRIIDQNLTYLNKRLSYYIDKIGLPHTVTFKNDLNVEITQFGQDLDFDNLSRGERNRLILSLSWAFRDVWENLYQHINLLFIDELIDAGMDAAGVEAGVAVLKKMARERNKNIYLISHKDELIGRVNTVLRVVKENGFTFYSNDVDVIET
jgi:DNA repair exonuclease SbcCD ATPase subunit